MFFQGLKWEGNLIVLYLYDTDGTHKTIRLVPAEALDLLMELKKEEARIVELVRAAIRRKGLVE